MRRDGSTASSLRLRAARWLVIVVNIAGMLAAAATLVLIWNACAPGWPCEIFSACRWAAFTGTTILMTPSLWGRLEASKRTTESFRKILGKFNPYLLGDEYGEPFQTSPIMVWGGNPQK